MKRGEESNGAARSPKRARQLAEAGPMNNLTTPLLTDMYQVNCLLLCDECGCGVNYVASRFLWRMVIGKQVPRIVMQYSTCSSGPALLA